VYGHGGCQGYLFFGLEDAALFLLVIMVILFQDARALAGGNVPLMQCVRLRLTPLLLTTSMIALLAGTAVASYGPILAALSRTSLSPW
jgi:hypothetical protein